MPVKVKPYSNYDIRFGECGIFSLLNLEQSRIK